MPRACPAFIPLGYSVSLLPRDVFLARRETQTASRPDLVSSDLFELDPGIDSDQGPLASRMGSISFPVSHSFHQNFGCFIQLPSHLNCWADEASFLGELGLFLL